MCRRAEKTLLNKTRGRCGEVFWQTGLGLKNTHGKTVPGLYYFAAWEGENCIFECYPLCGGGKQTQKITIEKEGKNPSLGHLPPFFFFLLRRMTTFV